MPGTVYNEFPARVGQIYKVVLAIILPCLLIVPFIYFLQYVRFKEEWFLWIVIVVFLAMLITLSLWLVLHSYPKALISIQETTIDIRFKKQLFFGRKNISFYFSDIISCTSKQLGDDEYFVIKTKNPNRKLQISASSNNEHDLVAFERAMLQIAGKLDVTTLANN